MYTSMAMPEKSVLSLFKNCVGIPFWTVSFYFFSNLLIIFHTGCLFNAIMG
jgi:hypothetical protein